MLVFHIKKRSPKAKEPILFSYNIILLKRKFTIGHSPLQYMGARGRELFVEKYQPMRAVFNNFAPDSDTPIC